MVRISDREHFICHYLLTKMLKQKSKAWFIMINAFMGMKRNSSSQRYLNSRLYESQKENFSLRMSKLQQGANNSQFGMKWIYSTELKQFKQ